MKQYLIILVLSSLFLGGCRMAPETKLISVQTGGEELVNNNIQSLKDDIPSTGMIEQGILFSGDNNIISLSGNLLNFLNEFSILLPKNIESWEYEYPIFKKEARIIFQESSMRTRYIIDQKTLDWLEQREDIKRNCRITNVKEEGVLSKKTIYKKLSNKYIYIISRTFELAGPDIIKPEKWDETTICFQTQNHIYNIHIGGYSSKELGTFIESLKFIDILPEYKGGLISEQLVLGSKISFSGDAFVYNKVFSFNFPKHINNWKYQTNSEGGDMMLYEPQNNNIIQVSTNIIPDNYLSMDTSNKCGMLYDSYKEDNKYNGNLIIFKDMYDVISDETIIPLTNRTTLCLADNQYIYGITLVNIEQPEIDKIINSFKFLK